MAVDLDVVHAAIAQQQATLAQPFGSSAAILPGGETTVGRGKAQERSGRYAEVALSFSNVVDGLAGGDLPGADPGGIVGSKDMQAFCPWHQPGASPRQMPDARCQMPDAK